MIDSSEGAGRRLRTAGEIRCDCDSLLARATNGGIELKCRRCKRLLLLRVDAGRVRISTVGDRPGSGRCAACVAPRSAMRSD